MKTARYRFWLAAVIGLLLCSAAFAQQAGDYRNVGNGNWSDAATWETFDGANWVAAGSAPSGSENITVGVDTVRIDVAVSITGYVTVADSGVVNVSTGSLAFADGSTYEHARDGGSLPTAGWAMGSTYLLTGTEGDSPGNRNQDFYNITLNTPNMNSNNDLGLDEVTIGGDIRVIDSGSSRWRLTSAPGGDTSIVTIMGDVLVEGGAFETQGTGNALTTFIVHHYGNINVTAGTFGISRGSQGSGSGTTTWYLHEGNLWVSNAEIRNSNPTPGNAKFVFAKGDTQQVTFDNVVFGGGDIHYEVSDSSSMEITMPFEVNGWLANYGEVIPLDSLTFVDGGVYEHARDAGAVPSAFWEEGSTVMFTGVTTTAPDNRGQDYYNIVLNTPGLLSNRDLDLDGHTVSGDITVISTGSARWQLVGGSSGTVTIMGDVAVQDGQFATQGTGSATDVVVDHYGDVNVTGGNFSVSRGSQSSGTGTTTWNLHAGNFWMSNATTQNSNPTPGNAKFVFTSDTTQTLTLGEGNTINALPIEVSSGTTLDVGVSEIGGDDVFVLNASATLVTAHPNGIDGNLQTTGEITFGEAASFTYNGAAAQVAGALLPDSVNVLTVWNASGVAFGDTVSAAVLTVSGGALMQIDSTGSVTADSGWVAGTVVNEGELAAVDAIVFADGGVYEHARNEGSIPTGVWNEGSTLLMTGIVDAAPGNRNQSYYNIVFNTPNMVSNRDMALDDVVIGGDIKVEDTGSARWRLTSASGGDTSIVWIMGDVIVENGSFETQGTGNALTVFEVHHYGDVIVTGGNFSVARGSQGSGSGSTRWFMHEGDFSMSDATTQNSNSTNAWFVFDSDTVQNISLTNVNYGGGGLAIVVAEGATLDFGDSQLGGGGLFGLNAGATLATANAGGVDSTLQTTGTVTLSDSANFVFNGSVAQVTGELMPSTVNGLQIDNEAGVTLSQITLINGVLRLSAGVFNNTIPFTLGLNGSISFEGGSLLIPVSVDQITGLPTEFALMQNYPNPFNPSTTIQYDLPEQAHVEIKIFDLMGRQVAELVNSEQNAGTYKVVWNAQHNASGVYFYRISAGDFTSVRKLVLTK